MGLASDGKPFTEQHILDRNLMLEMLKYEDKLYLGEIGQDIMRDIGRNNIFSLDGGKTIQRMTLNHFGFSSTPHDLANYRTIFHHYYKSPQDFDKEILQSVFYMRENRLLYYTTPILTIGMTAPDCNLLEVDSQSACTLYNVLNEEKDRTHVVCAFSLS
jgi:hypothetical protein